MVKKGIGLCLAVFFVGIGLVASAQGKSSNGVVSETFVVKIDSSSWVPKSFKVSPDSRHVVYIAKVDHKWSVVRDGKEGRKYDAVGTIPIFSPDSRRVAYVAKEGDKWFVVVDGKEGKRYDGIMNITGSMIMFSSRGAFDAIAVNEG